MNRIFPKKNVAKGKPLHEILWVHGSGWKCGGKSNAGIAKGLVDYGYFAAGVEYRLSGEALFPAQAQIQDSKSAVRWVRANSEKYGIDTERIDMMGRSAGRHLVTFPGTTEDIKEYDELTEIAAEFSDKHLKN